jgi:DNA primase
MDHRRIKLDPQQIESWVARHFEYRRRKGGQELKICNPFDGDTNYKFNINTLKGVCHDWRPGHQRFDGPFLRFVQKWKNITFYEALQDVCGQGVDLRSILQPKLKDIKEEEEVQIEPDVSLPEEAKSFRDPGESKLKQIALTYLNSRGINSETAAKYDLHYGVDRIYFPYYEYGVQVYWQARLIHTKMFDFPALEKTGGVGKENYLYGFDTCEPSQPVFIVESIIDAITLGDGTVATGGASMQKVQCRKVRAIGPSVIVLAPDRDYEGIMSIQKNAELLESVQDTEVKFVIPPEPYKDWNEMRDSKPRQYAENNLQSVTLYHINQLLKSF